MQNKPRGKKNLALALSGCGGRAVAYIGILEVFDENNIPIDIIASCSSATFVACSYSSGTMPKLKEKLKSMSNKEAFEIFNISMKSGIFSLDNLDRAYGEFLTVDNLEEFKIMNLIVASDITKGETVVFSIGNVLRAIKASCSMPGIFEPVVWGDKILVDGGLFSIVPVEVASEHGGDVVIGVDMAVSRNLFKDNFLHLKTGYDFFALPFRKFKSAARGLKAQIFGSGAQTLDYPVVDQIKVPNLGSVLGTAMDYAIKERKKGERFRCDLMLEPNVKGFSKIRTEDFEKIYLEGRRTAIEAMPRIKELLRDSKD